MATPGAKEPLQRRMIKAARIMTQIRGRGYGRCVRCHLPWNYCTGHRTQYEERCGCSPLCKDCWNELNPEERLPYYRALVDRWSWANKRDSIIDDSERYWPMIKKAVLAGQ